jgi:Putative zinc-finger
VSRDRQGSEDPGSPSHPAALARYVSGELSEGEAAAFEEHLAGCDTCQAEVDELRGQTRTPDPQRRQGRHGRYGRGSYPDPLHVRLPLGVKDDLATLGKRFGRDLSDEVRVALYNHLRRNGFEVPEEETEAPRSHEAVLRDLERLTATAQQLLDEDRGQARDQAAG